MTDLSDVAEHGGFPIDEIYVFIAKKNGVEGVPATQQRGLDGVVMMLPMVCTEVGQLADYVPVAEKMAQQLGPINLVKFSRGEVMQRFGVVDEDDEAPPPVIVKCLGGCGQRLHGPVIDRGFCLGCVPKDDDLAAARAKVLG